MAQEEIPVPQLNSDASGFDRFAQYFALSVMLAQTVLPIVQAFQSVPKPKPPKTTKKVKPPLRS